MPGEKEIAVVEDFYSHINVVALKVKGVIKVGDKLHFKGHTTDFIEEVKSMQKEHKDVEEAKKGDEIGLKTENRVRKHDKVYKVKE
ncbi:MAG: translation elongation factor-like protein [Spirochaetes bacterium]|nr:translation elongation factor-like protein [Spirochaetota bacterium]